MHGEHLPYGFLLLTADTLEPCPLQACDYVRVPPVAWFKAGTAVSKP